MADAHKATMQNNAILKELYSAFEKNTDNNLRPLEQVLLSIHPQVTLPVGNPVGTLPSTVVVNPDPANPDEALDLDTPVPVEIPTRLIQATIRLVKTWDNTAQKLPFNRLTLHSSATPPSHFNGGDAVLGAAAIKRWHTDPKPQGRGWRDTGYQFIIGRLRAFQIVSGRPMTLNGAHVLGENTNNLGICLLGGSYANTSDGVTTANDDFFAHYTDVQFESVIACIVAFRFVFERNMEWETRENFSYVHGHNDFTNMKTCPNFSASKFVNDNRSTLDQLFATTRKEIYRA